MSERIGPHREKSRFRLRFLGLCLAAAALVAACLPWPVTSPRLMAVIVDEVARSYGIALTIAGPGRIALLPVPRLDLGRARMNAGTAAGPLLAEAGTLSVQLSLLALLTGRIDLSALSLDGAALTLPMAADDGRWAVPLRSLLQRIGAASGNEQPGRLSLTRATLTGRDPRDGTIQTLHDVDVSLSAPIWGGRAELAARGTWRRQEGRINVSDLDMAALLDGRDSRFKTEATWPAGTLVLAGAARLGGVPQVSGRAILTTRSLPETLAWSGSGLALAPMIEAAAVETEFESRGKTLLLPRMRVAVGGNWLEGAGSMSFAENRLAIQATLAADSLDLSPLVGGLLDSVDPWSDPSSVRVPEKRRFVLGAFTAGDLDLRLSTGSARFGPVLVEDIASSLFVRKGSVEATVGRASLRGGTVKGRLALSAADDRGTAEVRAQGGFEGVDLGALLMDLGGKRWLAGAASGTFAVESRAASFGELVGRLNGRAAFTVNDGAISGLDLAAATQGERAVPAGLPIQRIGRTDFARAGFALRIKDGRCEIAEGMLAAPTLAASLGGTVSLVERRVEARAELAPHGGGPARSFEIVGPWADVAVRVVSGRPPETGPTGLAIMKPDPLRSPAEANLPAAVRTYAP